VSYILKGSNEAIRLDEQTTIPEFSLYKEFEDIQISSGAKVLDAGCGSGILCRFLERKYMDLQINGCDLNQVGLDHAQKSSSNQGSNYFHHNIVEVPLAEKYDYIFNRLVAHHLGEQKLKIVFENFFQALNQQGKVHVIDSDGLFLNLGTLSNNLKDKMAILKNAFGGNLQVGRLIPSLLHEVGFKNISWRIQMMDFQGESRKMEVEQWKSRFESALPFYIQTFGSEFEAKKFFKEYIQEASKEHVPLFYNKFIVMGEKS
jgi:cyclopropane fatty-acyl-phospholipid synthase-like methyltransferase